MSEVHPHLILRTSLRRRRERSELVQNAWLHPTPMPSPQSDRIAAPSTSTNTMRRILRALISTDLEQVLCLISCRSPPERTCISSSQQVEILWRRPRVHRSAATLPEGAPGW
jgi:hypothetical protein